MADPIIRIDGPQSCRLLALDYAVPHHLIGAPGDNYSSALMQQHCFMDLIGLGSDHAPSSLSVEKSAK
jgi:hypothetical protein